MHLVGIEFEHELHKKLEVIMKFGRILREKTIAECSFFAVHYKQLKKCLKNPDPHLIMIQTLN